MTDENEEKDDKSEDNGTPDREVEIPEIDRVPMKRIIERDDS